MLRRSLEEIGQYGIGLQLYFTFLRRIGWVLLGMGALNLPLLLFSLSGARLENLGTVWQVRRCPEVLVICR